MCAVYHGRRTGVRSDGRSGGRTAPPSRESQLSAGRPGRVVIVSTTSDLPVLSFDLGSPYAYLAVAHADSVLGRPPVLEPVRRSTEAAWEAGIRGVPTLRIGGQLFYGDDQLERARGAESDSP